MRLKTKHYQTDTSDLFVGVTARQGKKTLFEARPPADSKEISEEEYRKALLQSERKNPAVDGLPKDVAKAYLEQFATKEKQEEKEIEDDSINSKTL